MQGAPQQQYPNIQSSYEKKFESGSGRGQTRQQNFMRPSSANSRRKDGPSAPGQPYLQQ